MSMETPEHREVWQEADGTLLLCFNPGVWIRFGNPSPVMPNDPSIVFPLRRVFSKHGVPTMDDPIKDALLEDLAQAQKDRDRWRAKATWLSQHTTTLAHRDQPQPTAEAAPDENEFRPPPTTARDL